MTLIVAGYSGQNFFDHRYYDKTFMVGDTLLSQYNAATRNRDRLIETYKKYVLSLYESGHLPSILRAISPTITRHSRAPA